jgi:HTH-type transcriptional regulator/antitoxin HigA
MTTKGGIHSNLAIPPGEYLEEVLDELGMTKEELARRMDRPAPKLSAIFKGEKAITSDTALRLEKVLGVPAHIWTGLEAEYRLTLARQEEAQREDRLKEEDKLVSKYPYKDLVQAGEVENHTKPTDKARALQDYLGVISLTRVPKLQRYQAEFRIGKSKKSERTPEAVAAWLRMGERRAQRMHCAPFDEKRLRSYLDDLRALTVKTPEEFEEPLRQKLAECGVALVICPHFAKTKAHGAVFWIGREKAVLMITIRGRWADIFWFSLFHEIGHIALHNRQRVILEGEGEDQQEREADAFSSDALIPPEEYKLFVQRGMFYQSHIIEFAKQIGIAPGIVVGRLQHDNQLPPSWGNKLRSRYYWKET